MKKYLEKIRQLNEEEKALACFSVVCISFVMCIFTLLFPLWQKVHNVQEQFFEARSHLARYQSFANEPNYVEQSKMQAELLEQLQARLPKNLNVAEQVPQYYAWAEDSRVQLKNVKLMQGKQAKTQFVPIQLEMYGEYSKILTFLAKVEREGSFAILEKVAFKGESDGKVRVTTQLNVYLSQS